MGILSFEVGNHLGVGLVSEPLIRIDEDVIVMYPAGIEALRRGRVCHQAPIQSAKVRPEMRS